MRLFSLLVSFFFFSQFFPLLTAEEWKSPDGLVSVQIPDKPEFIEGEDVANTLVNWRNNSGSVFFTIVKMSLPAKIDIELDGFTEGSLNSFKKLGEIPIDGANVVSSSSKKTLGNFLFSDVTLKGQIKELNRDVFLRQKGVNINGSGYVFGVFTLGENPDQIPEVRSFFDSVVIHATSSKTENSDSAQKEGWDTHKISQKVGGAAFMLLMVALIIFFATRRKKN